MRATVLATLAAIAVQPFLFGVLTFLPLALRGADITLQDVGFFAFFVVAFATAFVVVLGLPAFFLLRRHGRATGRNVALAGAFIAAVPLAIFSWPGDSSRLSGYSSGGNWHGRYVRFYEDGVVTTYGWLSYAESVLYGGLHGLVGALVFYAVWRKLNKP